MLVYLLESSLIPKTMGSIQKKWFHPIKIHPSRSDRGKPSYEEEDLLPEVRWFASRLRAWKAMGFCLGSKSLVCLSFGFLFVCFVWKAGFLRTGDV